MITVVAEQPSNIPLLSSLITFLPFLPSSPYFLNSFLLCILPLINHDPSQIHLLLLRTHLFQSLTQLVHLFLPLFHCASALVLQHLLHAPLLQHLLEHIAPWSPPPAHLKPGFPDFHQGLQGVQSELTHSMGVLIVWENIGLEQSMQTSQVLRHGYVAVGRR